jgi:hypothetical protein
MEENILRINYSQFYNSWYELQKYLKLNGNPKYIIVGNVKLSRREDICDLGNLVGVDGNLNLNFSAIKSLGELEFVDGDFGLYECQNIKTLGKLKKVWCNLDLRYSSIESLGELELVFRNFDLFGCRNLKTLGKLKRVGGNLDLNNTTLELLGELQFVGDELDATNTKIPPSELDNVEVIGKIFR